MAYYSNTTRNVLALWRWAFGPETSGTIAMDWACHYTQEEARAFLRRGLHVRCSRGLPVRAGRKHTAEYQQSLWKAGQFLKGHTQWALNRVQPFQCADVARALPHVVRAWAERNRE